MGFKKWVHSVCRNFLWRSPLPSLITSITLIQRNIPAKQLFTTVQAVYNQCCCLYVWNLTSKLLLLGLFYGKWLTATRVSLNESHIENSNGTVPLSHLSLVCDFLWSRLRSQGPFMPGCILTPSMQMLLGFHWLLHDFFSPWLTGDIFNHINTRFWLCKGFCKWMTSCYILVPKIFVITGW